MAAAAKNIGRTFNRSDESDQGSVLLNNLTAVTIVAAKPRRISFRFDNPSNQLVWLKLQAASVDNLKEGIPVDKGDHWPMDRDNPYNGEISAIANVANPTVNFTEY